MSAFQFADQPHDLLAIFERRQQFAVVDVQHFRGGAQDLGGLLDFGRAPLRQFDRPPSASGRCRRS